MRRPDEIKGTLIYQQGKCIKKEYYIIAVYDDPSFCRITFAAYELETDNTYALTETYSEFDDHFKFSSELMNPSNQDKRFEWVIDHLDFIYDHGDEKRLCISPESPPSDDEEDEEEAPKAKSVAPPLTGKLDPATRAKLLKEMDTQGDQKKLEKVLVKSEEKRREFVRDLHAKRQLEQLKAAQRLLRADENRERRLSQLEIIKREQTLKRTKFLDDEKARLGTVVALEEKRRQRDAHAIRKLVQEKDEAYRGMGREKDAARHRRKMQERTEAEHAKFEAAEQQKKARTRDERVARHESRIRQRDKEIKQAWDESHEEERATQIRRQQEKERILEETWAVKREARQALEKKQKEFEAKEKAWEELSRARDLRRDQDEKERIFELRDKEKAEREATLEKRRKAHKEFLLAWKMEQSKKTLKKKEQMKRDAVRESNLEKRAEEKLRAKREKIFMDQSMRTLSLMGGNEPEEERQDHHTRTGGSDRTLLPSEANAMSNTDAERIQRTYEQVERQRRHAAREEQRKQEERKREKVKQLGSKDPNATELLRIHEWKQEQDAKKKAMDNARLSRELQQEAALRAKAEKEATHEAKWEELEIKRRKADEEADRLRNAKYIQQIKAMPIGKCLPSVLVY